MPPNPPRLDEWIDENRRQREQFERMAREASELRAGAVFTTAKCSEEMATITNTSAQQSQTMKRLTWVITFLTAVNVILVGVQVCFAVWGK